MRAFFVRFQFLSNYVLWTIFGIILYILGFFLPHSSSTFFLIATLYLIILPGYLFWRLLRIRAEGALRLLIFFGLGLAFYLIINLAAIFIGINIDHLIKIYGIILPLLFIATLISDWQKPFQPEAIVDWKKIWQKENIIYIVPIALSLFIFLVIKAKGADFNGDPYYHLAIVRKVVEGSKLNPASLIFSQTGSSNAAYAYPAWHIFVGGIAKILNLDIFTTWSKLTLPILVFTLLTWFQFSLILFGKKGYGVIAFIFFACFTFFGNAGYLFQRLTMPDTLAQYFLMPLAFILFLKYFFENQKGKRNLGLILFYTLTLISLLIVHGIHYFYVLFAVVLFSIIYCIYEPKNYRQILRGLGLTLMPLLVVSAVMELKSGFISDTLKHFSGSQNIEIAYSKFSNMGLRVQYSFLLTPFLFLFVRKQRKLIFLVILMLLTPLIYWTPLRDVSSRLFSFVFTDRLMGNVVLYYFVFAVFITFLLVSFDEAMATLSRRGKFVYYFLISIIFLMIISLEVLHQSFSHFFEIIFYSDNISSFLTQNVLIVLSVIVLITLVLLVFQRYKKNLVFDFKDFNYTSNAVIFSALIAFILLSPSIVQSRQALLNARYVTNARSNIISEETLGKDGWQFLADLTPKSVILADDEATKELSTLVNHYMAYNLSSAAEAELMMVYDNGISDDKKIQLLKSSVYKIDYVYVRPAYSDSLPFFNGHPGVVEKVFEGEAKIYKVIK